MQFLRCVRHSPFREPNPGWQIEVYWGRRWRRIVAVDWQPYDNTRHLPPKAPWVPFVADYWNARLRVLDRVIWRWRRYSNRYGRAA